MIILINILLLSLFISTHTAPVRKDAEKPTENTMFNDLHYRNYLEEVIKELEKDKTFIERVKDVDMVNRTEYISQSLQFVHHKIRNKLDEIKRREIERLNILENELERKRLKNSGSNLTPRSSPEKVSAVDKNHINHSNVESFEISDLEMLIKKAEEDLTKVDRQQEEQYKEHEMKKAYAKKKKLENAKNEEERKNLEKKFSESEKRHKDHPKVNQPGSEEQLKEVWEKADHLDKKEFNPLVFFNLHDVNGDNHLDIQEVEALMQSELSKVYEANNSDDDMQERFHEMMRMRQGMLDSMDLNKDKMISKEEFLKFTSTEAFKQDNEWKTKEEENEKVFTEDEYKQFEDAYSHSDMEEDDFSDLDESLRYTKPPKQVIVTKDDALPPPKENIKPNNPPEQEFKQVEIHANQEHNPSSNL